MPHAFGRVRRLTVVALSAVTPRDVRAFNAGLPIALGFPATCRPLAALESALLNARRTELARDRRRGAARRFAFPRSLRIVA